MFTKTGLWRFLQNAVNPPSRQCGPCRTSPHTGGSKPSHHQPVHLGALENVSSTNGWPHPLGREQTQAPAGHLHPLGLVHHHWPLWTCSKGQSTVTWTETRRDGGCQGTVNCQNARGQHRSLFGTKSPLARGLLTRGPRALSQSPSTPWKSLVNPSAPSPSYKALTLLCISSLTE